MSADDYPAIYGYVQEAVHSRAIVWRPEVDGGLLVYRIAPSEAKEAVGLNLYVDEGTVALLELMKGGKTYEDVVRSISVAGQVSESSAISILNERLSLLRYDPARITGCPTTHPYTSSAPQMAGLEITSQCPLRCIYCYAGAGPQFTQRLSLPEVVRILDQLKEVGIPTIWITGGEPFAHPDIRSVLEEAQKRDFYVNVATSGIPLYENPSYVELVQNYVNEIHIAVDGARPQTHDFYRGKGTFHKVVQAIRSLVEGRGQDRYIVVMGTALCRSNYQEIPEIVGLATELGVDYWVFGSLADVGRGDLVPGERLSPEELVQAYRSVCIVRGQQPAGSRTRLLDCLAWVTPIEPRPIRKTLRCGAANFQIHIWPNGDVYPCAFLRDRNLRLGNVLEEDLRRILLSPVARYFRTEIDQDSTDRYGLVDPACRVCTIHQGGYCNGYCKAVGKSCTKDVPGSPLNTLEVELLRESASATRGG